MVSIGWRYPPIDWVKINVDGCSKGTQGWLELVQSLGMIWDGGLWVLLLILESAIANGLKLA
jgi:hypothetical protein